MLIEDAIKDIKECIKSVVGGISLDIAIDALEKQLPKEVINKQSNYVKFCPVCQSALLRERDIYCSDCGQKLKWD